MTVKQEGGKRTYALTKAKPGMLRRCKRRQAPSLELPSDVWFEILSRLPTKTLVTAKRACKAWRDIASHILVYQRKMPFLRVRGLFLEVCRFPRDEDIDCTRDRFDSYLAYISLTTKEISTRIVSPGDHTVSYGYSEQMLENLSLDLSALYAKPSLIAVGEVFYTGHNGLLLMVHIDGTYKVLNPATKQVLDLPKPSSAKQSGAGGIWIRNNAVINLSCPVSSTASSFVVIGFLKPQKLVKIYYPRTRKWVQYGFSLADILLEALWYLTNYVFIHGTRTLFFLTNGGQGVALQFGSLDQPKICSSYGFGLPEVVHDKCRRATLGESQGCLYLSHANMDVDGVWIWKHDGVSSANPWILLFEMSSTNLLCKPVAKEHLLKYYDAGYAVIPMGFHPEVLVVFLYFLPHLVFAYDLTNDTFEEIAKLNAGERLRIGSVIPYSPCLASLDLS